VKLLLVEDDTKIAAAVKRGLEAEGFSVEVASDGGDGLWRATEGAYDLILLDIMLPSRNGYQICADLRKAGIWTPILMLTAKDGDLDEAEALEPAPTTTSPSRSPSPSWSPGSGRCCAAPAAGLPPRSKSAISGSRLSPGGCSWAPAR